MVDKVKSAMYARVVYILYNQHNQLCNPAICFTTYAYAYPIAQSIYLYVCAYVYFAHTQHLLPGMFLTISRFGYPVH